MKTLLNFYFFFGRKEDISFIDS